jgi:hypothetical protein
MSSTWVNQYFVKFKERCRGGIHQSYRKKLSYGTPWEVPPPLPWWYHLTYTLRYQTSKILHMRLTKSVCQTYRLFTVLRARALRITHQVLSTQIAWGPCLLAIDLHRPSLLLDFSKSQGLNYFDNFFTVKLWCYGTKIVWDERQEARFHAKLEILLKIFEGKELWWFEKTTHPTLDSRLRQRGTYGASPSWWRSCFARFTHCALRSKGLVASSVDALRASLPVASLARAKDFSPKLQLHRVNLHPV